MFKAQISEAGVTVPALAYSIHPNTANLAIASLENLNNMERIMDQIISHIEKPSVEERKTTLTVDNETAALGNLHRTVNAKGNIRWNCIDHFYERHSEMAVKAFHDAVESLAGLFDQNLGHITLTLHSRDQADQLHLALEEAMFIYELEISLCWDTTYDDFKSLRDVLVNIGVLHLDLNYSRGPDSDSLNHARRYNPVLGIMRHTSIKSVILVRPPADLSQSNLLSCCDDLSSLKHLSVNLTKLGSDIPGLRNSVAKSPNLAHLILICDSGRLLSVYSAITEYQSCPITFPNQMLRVLPLANDTLPLTDLKDMSDLLEVHGRGIETVEVGETELEEPTVTAFLRKRPPRVNQS
ncbi:hypothetical protein BGX34_010067 [Mortierella sp. NVP85]|nr:hypothetical protein BGX34_010067 [Mortierella sp. NVP85]